MTLYWVLDSHMLSCPGNCSGHVDKNHHSFEFQDGFLYLLHLRIFTAANLLPRYLIKSIRCLICSAIKSELKRCLLFRAVFFFRQHTKIIFICLTYTTVVLTVLNMFFLLKVVKFNFKALSPLLYCNKLYDVNIVIYLASLHIKQVDRHRQTGRHTGKTHRLTVFCRSQPGLYMVKKNYSINNNYVF